MYRTLLALAAFALLLLAPRVATAQNLVNAPNSITGDVTWTADNTYILDGHVFVENGATLAIEAGTVVKGKPNPGANASALIVTRGGKIYANGTASDPIVFTAESDDVNDPNDLPLDARGLWGGVIILGKASLNSTPGETAIEGVPVTEGRGLYGCDPAGTGSKIACDDEDDSGVFRYVSIRYGGSDIGAGNEINGLTMGGVGSGTTIEFVEVFNNKDDGFEWFGGTANTRYLISAFNGDDAMDYDEGFRGKGQFWFVVQAADVGGRAGEHDGGTKPEDGKPYAVPVISNATYIGSGANSTNDENDDALEMRDNAGGKYYNSIFHDFHGGAVDIEDLDSGEDSRARLEAGDIVLAYNIFGSFGKDDIAGSDWELAYLKAPAQGNRIVDPMLRGISRANDGGLDPRPADASPARSGANHDDLDDWFLPTDYVGAFGDVNWAADWAFISDAGILTRAGAGVPEPTSAEPLGEEIPSAFALGQNYPNPFNPSTTIEFSLETGQNVTLSVYDMLGRQVRTLIDGVQAAGQYRVSFDGADLASGAYLYVLRTEQQVAAKTMSLLK